MLLRLLLVAALVFLIWRIVRKFLAPPTQPNNPINEPLVRCDRCGIQIPTSQLAQVRATCKRCANAD